MVIESITIADQASFGKEPEMLHGLSMFNYIYGANGTGKTTISRIIAGESMSQSCGLVWEGGRVLTTTVYNRDFVDRNFDQAEAIPGIFTLGEENVATVRRIRDLRSQIRKLDDRIAGLDRTLNGGDNNGGKMYELTVLDQEFETDCWRIKQKYDQDFHGAFAGVRNSKRRFRDRVVQEWGSNREALLTFEELRKAARTVFSENVRPQTPVGSVDFAVVVASEGHRLLGKPIVGKEDVDVAAMIAKLGNSDWVREGLKYFRANDGVCPFCQQSTDTSLAARLNEYFDEAFERDMTELKAFVEDYDSQSKQVLRQLEQLVTQQHPQIDQKELSSDSGRLKVLLERNIERLNQKLLEPSRVIQLVGVIDVKSSIETIIKRANVRVAEHNRMVDDIDKERTLLTSRVWKFLLETELKSMLQAYERKRTGLQKAVDNLTTTIERLQKERAEKISEMRSLEGKSTSVQPTIDDINRQLSSFGFHGFKLASAERAPFYKLVRQDGSDAKTTLSEGEKTFVSFLYFYHLLRGSTTRDGLFEERVVVFDDPISSLDSDVLFLVSSLIRNLRDEMSQGLTSIRQMFVLTHNVYFFKEVTFSGAGQRDKPPQETFWVLRKREGVSQLESYSHNPIRTSYELLWDELKPSRRDALTIRNTLRRILETYFTFYGGIELRNICDGFEGEERSLCGSLVSWIHDGSHHVDDGVFAPVTDEVVEKYLAVFQRIFEALGHTAHYDMMMRDVVEAGRQIVRV